jgi:tRNA(fMet)-specific endonuclease VapC
VLKFLLDTDTCIYALRHRPGRVRDMLAANEGRMAISAVTLFELAYGAEKSRHVERNLGVLESFASRLELKPFDSKAAFQAGQIRAELERKGTPIGAYDLMIAGQARSEGLILVTSNTREFKRVSGLRLENWA